MLQGGRNHMKRDAVSCDCDVARNMWYHRVASSCDCIVLRFMWLWFWRGRFFERGDIFFGHQTGPEQTLRRENWTDRREISVRVSFVFKKNRIFTNVPWTCYFWKKQENVLRHQAPVLAYIYIYICIYVYGVVMWLHRFALHVIAVLTWAILRKR